MQRREQEDQRERVCRDDEQRDDAEREQRAAVPASSSDGETGRRGSSRSRVTSQPMPLSSASPSRPNTGQSLAGELSGGSGTEGALGQTPTSANSSKIATVQSQKQARLR